MITVELIKSRQSGDGSAVVEVFCDRAGLLFLQRQIELLLSGETHVHLMTPGWAGTELSEVSLGEGVVVNHLRLIRTPDPLLTE